MNIFQQFLRHCAVAVALTGFSIPTSGFSREGLMPEKLDFLFSVLPDNVEDWRLTRSTGWKGVDRWVESVVTREFERTVTGPDERPAVQKVKLTIKDTAKFPRGDLELFSNFTPKKEEDVEYLYLRSVPAIMIEKESRLVVMFQLSERFILTISFDNLPKTELGKWFRRVKIDSLASVKDGPVVKLPRSISEQSIDQLKGRNKGFTINVGDVEVEEE